jgi:hypothetical protein
MNISNWLVNMPRAGSRRRMMATISGWRSTGPAPGVKNTIWLGVVFWDWIYFQPE